MLKKKDRMAGYIRESDPTLANSNTLDSARNAVRLYGEREGYSYSPEHEYTEAISAYMVPYLQRKRLLDMLDAAKHNCFDVVVVTEIRAISRRQVEVFIIYNMLQKYHVRLETISEKFEDSAMGRIILSLRARFAEVEREQIYTRLQRGKKSRLEGGAPNGHAKPAYGYNLIDSAREVKSVYEFNHTVVWVDDEGQEWSEYLICLEIFKMLAEYASLRSIAQRLNDLGIPPPRKAIKSEPHWTPSGIYRMVGNPIYYGEVWGNRFKKVGRVTTPRPKEEWVRLPDAPAMISKKEWERVQKQFAINREDSARNNKHKDEEVGLLRAGYIFCGICGRRMQVCYPGPAALKNHSSPYYRCRQKAGSNHAINHSVQIHLPEIDKLAWQKVVGILINRQKVRSHVEKLKQENKSIIDFDVVEKTIESIETEMKNIFELARHTTTASTMEQLGSLLHELEKQKVAAEILLENLGEDEEERANVEKEIVRFEQWLERVRPDLLNLDYNPTYQEKRRAIHMIGIRVTIYPTNGGYPHRYMIDLNITRS